MWQTRREFEKHIIERAFVDVEFRESLKKNPKMVVEELLGEKLPEYLQLKIIEEDPSNVYIVLPTLPSAALNEDELEAVKGGVPGEKGVGALPRKHIFARF